MTTIQKTLVAVALTASIGTGLYEARQAARYRDQLQALRQSQVPLVEQIERLKREGEDTSRKLILSTATKATQRFNWESLESSDYRTYLANLRAVGCPEETIRDIIRGDVHKLYEEKKKQAYRSAPRLQYWRENGQQYIRDAGREMWMNVRALNEERNALLRSLGVEPDYRMQAVKESDALDLMLDFLADEKKAQVVRLRKELEDRLATRDLNSVDADAIDRLRKEMEDAMKRLLTPEEGLQYDLRMSPTASSLRAQLAAFEPTEQEFVLIKA